MIWRGVNLMDRGRFIRRGLRPSGVTYELNGSDGTFSETNNIELRGTQSITYCIAEASSLWSEWMDGSASCRTMHPSIDVKASRNSARERIRNIKTDMGRLQLAAGEKRELLAKIADQARKLDLLSDVEKREQARKKVMEPAGRSIDLSEDDGNSVERQAE